MGNHGEHTHLTLPPDPYWPRLHALVVVTGPDYNGSHSLVGRVGRVIEVSTLRERYEIQVDDRPNEFLPFRTWVDVTHLEPYVPPPRDDPEKLEQWLAR